MGFNVAFKGLIMVNRKNGDKGEQMKLPSVIIIVGTAHLKRKAPYTLLVKLSDFTARSHTRRKN